MTELLGIAGSGAIACGLAAVAAETGDVAVLARSQGSADRARVLIESLMRRSGAGGQVLVGTDAGELAGCTYLVEAVAEDLAVKSQVLAEVDAATGRGAVLATTTSSLSVAALAAACSAPERFACLHVFNPVQRMALVEVAFPAQASDGTRARTIALCARLGKRAVVTPDIPGFVVNRLLFPYLFAAVRLMEQTGMDPSEVDACMTLGAGHPMGPLELLDFVGLDIAAAIGEAIDEPAPPALLALLAEGALGRKSGRGFHDYAPAVDGSAAEIGR